MPQNHVAMLLMTFTLLCATSAQAEIYKWVDANGVTHYGDSAPTTRQSQTLDFGQIRRPAAPRRPARQLPQISNTRLSFPSEPRQVRRQPARSVQPIIRPARQTITSKPPRLKRKSKPTQRSKVSTPSQRSKASKVNKIRREVPEQQPFKEIQLAGKFLQNQAITSEEKPNLDAEEYDFQYQPKSTKKKAIKNVKLKLCSEKRMLLAALQEKGFNSYFDEEGHFRLAWGGDGIYQGKRRYLSEDEVAKETEKAMFEVGQYCDNPYDRKLQETARANWIRAEYCAVSKAVLEDLEHPFMRSTDSDIRQQIEKVERHCAELAPGRYRNDDRYYPDALKSKVVLPRHLTVKEDDDPEIVVTKPKETVEQLLALIE